MDNNITKALWIGVGVLFFIAVVSIGISLLNQSTEIAQEQAAELSNIQKRLSESKFSAYDNTTVTGSQVLSCIKNFRGEKDVVAIQVKTKKGTTVYLNTASFSADSVTLGSGHSDSVIENAIKDARNESDSKYINPVGSFDAQVRKDSNGVICGITFEQK